jgi:DNA (cytosine-5)-methyltransferase 1
MRVVELFAGIGGLGLGLQQAGLQLVTGYEHWDKALDVWEWNSRTTGFKFDLSNVSEAALHIMEAAPAMIAGGPPCTDYSAAGKRTLGKNAALTQAFAMIIAIVRPEWFIFENVTRAPLSKNYRTMRKILSRAGYGLTEIAVLASHYSTPQARQRFLCIGRLGQTDQFLESAIVEAASKNPMSVRSILDPREFPDDAELVRRTGYFVRPYTGGQGVHRLDKPAPTIIRSSTGKPNRTYRDNPHPKDHIPYDQAWQLTERQAMRIQGFPADFDMGGVHLREKGKPYSQRDRMQMIANAVPPPLAEAIGEIILARHAGDSIPAIDPGFEKFLVEKFREKFKETNPDKDPGKDFKKEQYAAQIANMKSRVNRARRILRGRTYADIALELSALENEPAFAALDIRQKSDLRVALRLYHEHTELRPPTKYAKKAARPPFFTRGRSSATPASSPATSAPSTRAGSGKLGKIMKLNADQLHDSDYEDPNRPPDDPRYVPDAVVTDRERFDPDSFDDTDE